MSIFDTLENKETEITRDNYYQAKGKFGKWVPTDTFAPGYEYRIPCIDNSGITWFDLAIHVQFDGWQNGYRFSSCWYKLNGKYIVLENPTLEKLQLVIYAVEKDPKYKLD